MAYYVRPEICPQSHKCPMIIHCPVGAIKQEGFNAPIIDRDLCINCGKCAKICAMKAVVKVD